MSVKKYNLLINGKEREGREYFEVRNPYTGKVIAEVAYGGEEEIEEVGELCERAIRERELTESFKRTQILNRAKELLIKRKKELTNIIVEEAGKPLKLSRGEVERAITTIELACGEVHRYGGEVLPLDIVEYGKHYRGFYRYFPAGPVLAITPFNFPLNLLLHKVAPALGIGAPVVVKPSPRTPITAYHLVKIFINSGCPPAFIHFLPVPNHVVKKLVENDKFKVVSFTGSAEVGWQIKKMAWDKKVLLELGGNAAAVVHRDADLAWASKRIVQGGFAYAGQICISVQRVYVHRDIYKTFKEMVIQETENLKVGNPQEEDVIVGPMISSDACERVEAWVNEAVSKGGKVLTGGRRENNIYYPTVLENVPPTLKIVQEEVFGPVIVLFEYDKLSDAINMVNDSIYGLQAGIFTSDIRTAMEFYEGVEAGGIVINDYPTFRVDNYPYGGVKKSGFGREGIRYAMQEMSEMKMCVIKV